ncbi:EamA family transporter [Pikeienuella piscinae]|uniref:EamA family transporter n=1 Tax=Pikeienuella piscinae TaxID=2748098 RepID=A0A7L5BWJ3_9RHOB|nr:EamA family transporter [Pikeienuella piscinae]QIE54907.1 EamA family transporter [Pikeienuella piscinae]
MIALWIPVTIAAAFLQNLRSALQKALKGRLSTAGAAYARFFYAWPFALIFLFAVGGIGGYEAPQPNLAFFLWCALGGLSQILFTVVLLWMFSFRSFAVGTTFSKLEVVLIAILGAALLGDTVGPLAGLAIAIGAAGTVLLAATEARLTLRGLIGGIFEKPTLIGLLSAALLGGSVVCFRGAALALDGPDFLMAAAYALVVALLMQTAMMGAWFLAFDRPELTRVLTEWRRAAPVGLVGMACSACWFTAFTLQNAAYVRALGQIELLFTFLAGALIFRERARATELAGVGLVVVAVLLILFAGQG